MLRISEPPLRHLYEKSVFSVATATNSKMTVDDDAKTRHNNYDENSIVGVELMGVVCCLRVDDISESWTGTPL